MPDRALEKNTDKAVKHSFATQTLERGLMVLAAIVRADIGLTPGEVAKQLKMSRPGAYRAIAGLSAQGYVRKLEAGGRYVLSHRALEMLSARKADDARMAALHRIMKKLCAEIVWPVSVAGRASGEGAAGLRMLVWATTDAETSLTLERFGAGFTVPMLESASGLAYLAHVNGDTQYTLLHKLAASKEPFADLARNRTRVMALLRDCKKRGAAMTTHEPRARRIRTRSGPDSAAQGRTTSMSVPIMVRGEVLACIAMRYFDSAMSRPKAMQRYLRTLQDAAAEIAKAWG